MELKSLLSHDPAESLNTRLPNGDSPHPQPRYHQYPTRHSTSSTMTDSSKPSHKTHDSYSTPPPNTITGHLATPRSTYASPQDGSRPKNVTFELLFPESPQYRARPPMRVQIFPHDTTDSIITTVKNFYGLYEGPGGAKRISFEDEQGQTLIASHENFENSMIVYVRVLVNQQHAITEGFAEPRAYRTSASPNRGAPSGTHPGEYDRRLPQSAQSWTYGPPLPQPTSRVARDRSASPAPDRRRPGPHSRGSSAHGTGADVNHEASNGYSDSDGGHGSVTSSKKAKGEHLASAEISLENIVEGGRRRRAKFESSVSGLTGLLANPHSFRFPPSSMGPFRQDQSLTFFSIDQELPLFVPPQVPMAASSSSLSPARRPAYQMGPAPFAQPGQRLFAYPHPVVSPHGPPNGSPSANLARSGSNLSTPSAPPHGHHLRNRMSGADGNLRRSSAATPTGPRATTGILPTPDPTVASCISDEDAAIQLMRLGDVSHGTRHSASPLDDGLSGVADTASSTGGTSGAEDFHDVESDGTEQAGLPVGPPRAMLESSPIPLPGSIKRRHKHLDEILPSFDSTEPSGDESGRFVRADATNDSRDGTFTIKHEVISKRKDDRFMQQLEMAIQPETAGPKIGANVASKSRSHHAKSKARSHARAPGGPRSKSRSSPQPAGAIPISPASLPTQSRKTSGVASIPLGEDEEDLSSKPRCQRCRKSKKGCDRQRPCQRCKDAGIGADGCVSEDEGNGRKGRFGRHMGVIVKKGCHEGAISQPSSTIASPAGPMAAESSGAVVGVGLVEKSKKRKRT